MKATLFVVVLVAVLALSSSNVLAESRCTTTYNEFLKRSETRCDDGSSATEKYNPFLKRYEGEITPAPTVGGGFQPTIRCTRTWNAFLKRMEEVCN